MNETENKINSYKFNNGTNNEMSFQQIKLENVENNKNPITLQSKDLNVLEKINYHGQFLNSNEKTIEKINYSEFIEKMGMTKKAEWVYILANFLQFIWGMEACFISINIERFASYSKIPDSTKSILISVLYSMLGIGSILMGSLTKLIGRIKLIVLSTIIYTFFVLLCSFPLIENFYIIFSFRCIVNISLGIFNISILNLLTEYLPIKRRSYVLMVNSGLYNFGNIFIVIINNIFLSDMNKNFKLSNWRIINLLCVIPGLVSLIISIFYVEESPLYLINNEGEGGENSKRAFRILKEMSKEKKIDFNEDLFNAIKANVRSLESFKLKSHYKELFLSDYIRLTICNTIICSICYMNMVGISYITPKTLNEKAGSILNMSFDTQLFIYGLIQLPNGYIGGCMTESKFFGRKKTIWISSLICGIFYFIINFLPFYISIYAGIIMLFNSIAFGGAFIYVSEIYPTNLRDQAQSLIQSISFIIGSFSPFLIDYIYSSSFILLGITCLLCIFVTIIVGEETNMRPLDVENSNQIYKINQF